MPVNPAQDSHKLASQINEARLRGDHDEANRLIALFNQLLFSAPTTQGDHQEPDQVSAGQVQANSAMQPPSLATLGHQIAELTKQYQNLANQQLNPQPQTQTQQQQAQAQAISGDQLGSAAALSKPIPSQAPATNQPDNSAAQNIPAQNANPAPMQPVSLAQAVMMEQQPPSTNQPANQPASSTMQPQAMNTAPQPPLPVNNVAANSGPISTPKAPDINFKDLIDKYHEGVQALLKRYLKTFAAELEMPEAVLGPMLIKEFIDLWHERQQEEPLLLKLPEYIQQRSVLLRFSTELKDRLE